MTLPEFIHHKVETHVLSEFREFQARDTDVLDLRITTFDSRAGSGDQHLTARVFEAEHTIAHRHDDGTVSIGGRSGRTTVNIHFSEGEAEKLRDRLNELDL